MAIRNYNITWDPVSGSTGYLVEYKLSTSSTWIIPTTSPNPTLNTFYLLEGIDTTLSYNVRVSSNGVNCIKKYTIIPLDRSAPCCPSGYTLSPDDSYCYTEDTQPADYIGGGSPTLLCHYQHTTYTCYGMAIYQEGLYNIDSTWNIANPAAKPDLYVKSGVTGYNPTSFNVNIVASSFPYLNDTCGTVTGRLNLGGLWVCGSPSAIGIYGFSRQINVPTTKTYFIGMGSDNVGTLIINGTTVVAQNETNMDGANYYNSGGAGVPFLYWHVYPVTLTAGPNIINMQVNNTGSLGIMGFEIYDATRAQIVAAANASAILGLTIFSTVNIPNNTPSDVGNYDCHTHPGYSLVYDPGTNSYSCKLITTTTTISC